MESENVSKLSYLEPGHQSVNQGEKRSGLNSLTQSLQEGTERLYRAYESCREGMEPKVIAYKALSDKDKENIINEKHKFYKSLQICHQLFKNQKPCFHVEDSLRKTLLGLRKTLLGYGKGFPTEQKLNQLLQRNDIGASLTSFFENKTIDKIDKNIEDLIIAIHSKYQKRHFVKFKYNERFGVVARDLSTCIAKANEKIHYKILAAVGGFFYYLFKMKTIRSANRDAVLEVMARDVYAAVGVESAKVKLHASRYKKGKINIQVDSTQAQGPNGEPTFKISQQDIKNEPGEKYKGKLIDNQITYNGQKYPVNMNALGKCLMKAIWLGDLDKLGSKFDNMMFYIKHGQAFPIMIDPGKAFSAEKNYLPLTNELKYDDKMPKTEEGFKNFAYFLDQMTLSQRKEAIVEIRKEWKNVCEILDAYKEAVAEHPGYKELQFADQINAKKEYLELRLKAMEELSSRQKSL